MRIEGVPSQRASRLPCTLVMGLWATTRRPLARECSLNAYFLPPSCAAKALRADRVGVVFISALLFCSLTLTASANNRQRHSPTALKYSPRQDWIVHCVRGLAEMAKLVVCRSRDFLGLGIFQSRKLQIAVFELILMGPCLLVRLVVRFCLGDLSPRDCRL